MVILSEVEGPAPIGALKPCESKALRRVLHPAQRKGKGKPRASLKCGCPRACPERSRRVCEANLGLLSSLHQPIPSLPGLQQSNANQLLLLIRALRILNKPSRLRLSQLQQFPIPHQIRHAKIRQSCLPRPKKLPRPAQLQIQLSKLKPVRRAHHRRQSLLTML